MPSFVIAVEHQIPQAGRWFKLGIGTVLSDEQIGGAPDIGFGSHPAATT
jgi:hypothetical protein